MKPVMSEETKRVVEAMEEATWNAIEGYRQTGLPVPVWHDDACTGNARLPVRRQPKLPHQQQRA